jgi:hypothetical protein
LLASYFPGLTPVSGTLEWTDDGTAYGMDHWWNTRGDGVIIDSTWQPSPGARGVTYRQDL